LTSRTAEGNISPQLVFSLRQLALEVQENPAIASGFLLPTERAIQQKEFADVERNQMR